MKFGTRQNYAGFDGRSQQVKYVSDHEIYNQ